MNFSKAPTCSDTQSFRISRFTVEVIFKALLHSVTDDNVGKTDLVERFNKLSQALMTYLAKIPLIL